MKNPPRFVTRVCFERLGILAEKQAATGDLGAVGVSGTIFSRLLKHYSTCHSEGGSCPRNLLLPGFLRQADSSLRSESQSTPFFSNLQTNQEEQRGIMTKVRKMGVVDGGRDADG